MRLRTLYFILLLFLPVACGVNRTPERARRPFGPTVVRVGGSDTMLILTRLWAEEFMRSHAGISVYSWGGGTGQGVRQLISGDIDICAASRPLRPDEVRAIAEEYGAVGVVFAVAKEALSIYIHPENPVQALAIDELAAIFRGEVRNWRTLGGHDQEIRVLRRSSLSGTYLYFREHVLRNRPYWEGAEVFRNTQGIVGAVEEDPAAIGFGGLAYGRNLHARINGVSPTEESVRGGRYPITRYLFLVTVSPPRGAAKSFIDWVLTREGQQLVSEAGYVSLW